MVSLRVPMRFDCAVFGDEAGCRVVALIDDLNGVGRPIALAVTFAGIGLGHGALWLRPKSLQRAGFGNACASGAPALLQDAHLDASSRIFASSHVVVAPRGEQGGPAALGR